MNKIKDDRPLPPINDSTRHYVDAWDECFGLGEVCAKISNTLADHGIRDISISTAVNACFEQGNKLQDLAKALYYSDSVTPPSDLEIVSALRIARDHLRAVVEIAVSSGVELKLNKLAYGHPPKKVAWLAGYYASLKESYLIEGLTD